MLELRPYQKEASQKAVEFFSSKEQYHAIMVLPTGAGKSIIIADIAKKLNGNTLILQPSKEILEQNYKKLRAISNTTPAIYSASLNSKKIGKITFATIGSIKNAAGLFQHFSNIIIDECHLVAPTNGMYANFIKSLENIKVLGLTATPYRLKSYRMGSMLKMINRGTEKVFSHIIYHIQIEELLRQGFLAPLSYYYTPAKKWNSKKLIPNSTGAEYTDKSIQEEYKRSNFHQHVIDIIKRLQRPKDGNPRRGILVFVRFKEDAESISQFIPNSAWITADFKKKDREQILANFKSGKTQVVINVGILTTGFDYPELDTIVLARPTMSLSLYYQMIGRIIRPHQSKEKGWVVDLCGSTKTFGRIEKLKLINANGKNNWNIYGEYKQLTNRFL